MPTSPNAKYATRPAGVIGIALLIAHVVLLPGAQAEEQKRDWDIRCCLEEEDLDKFVIELAGIDRPVGHLSVTTPSGVTIGYDDTSKTFSHTTIKEGLYALGRRPQPFIGANSWNHHRYALVYRYTLFVDPRTKEQRKIYQTLEEKQSLASTKRLDDGRYLIRVYGLFPGRYKLTFYPYGIRYGAAANFGGNAGIEINSGEFHEYTFDGANIQAPNLNSKVLIQPLEVKRVR